jgi:hypothetical protein
LAALAVEGITTMRKIGVKKPTSFLPSTLPVGSGNEDYWGGGLNAKYYPDQEAAILAETTGSIALETGTEDAIDS